MLVFAFAGLSNASAWCRRSRLAALAGGAGHHQRTGVVAHHLRIAHLALPHWAWARRRSVALSGRTEALRITFSRFVPASRRGWPSGWPTMVSISPPARWPSFPSRRCFERPWPRLAGLTEPNWQLGPLLPGGLVPAAANDHCAGRRFAGSLMVGNRIGRRDFDAPCPGRARLSAVAGDAGRSGGGGAGHIQFGRWKCAAMIFPGG